MTLKAIAGIVKPDQGNITIGNRILFDSTQHINLKPQLRRIGYLFQSYALFPNMTVEENICIGYQGKCFFQRKEKKNRNNDIYDQSIHEYIKQFHLDGLEHHYPSQLSGGQQQRVALARLFAYEPEVLLLDEPFAALDAYLREQLRIELKQWLKAFHGLTVFVTHDRDEVFQLCDNLLMMHQGKVLCQGTTKELFESPQSYEAAKLTGCKNLSKAFKTGKNTIKAVDWNMELCTEKEVPDDIAAVGIRAHDLIPLSEQKDRKNCFAINRPMVMELPFEWQITCSNHLLWKVEKEIYDHQCQVIPRYLYLPPERILLLEE